MKATALSVGEAARRAGVAVSTLHFYERQGLIRSHRTAGNQRRYDRDVLRRVAVIQVAQTVGISLADVRAAFASLPEGRTPTRQDWARLSQGWAVLLDTRIALMQRLRDDLGDCIGCGCFSLERCPIRNPADRLGQDGPGARLLLQPPERR
ncbi:MAG: redox-sensitive transcriptional activator SoxR [Bauldia sp.]